MIELSYITLFFGFLFVPLVFYFYFPSISWGVFGRYVCSIYVCAICAWGMCVAYICICMCVFSCVCVVQCVWGGYVLLCVLSLSELELTDLVARNLQESRYLNFHSSEAIITWCCIQIWTLVLGNQVQVLVLGEQTLYWLRVHFPQFHVFCFLTLTPPHFGLIETLTVLYYVPCLYFFIFVS